MSQAHSRVEKPKLLRCKTGQTAVLVLSLLTGSGALAQKVTVEFDQGAEGLASAVSGFAAAQHTSPSHIKIETLASSTSSWDGAPYKAYPSGQPEITVRKIAIAPHTIMKWHSHPMPNAAYVLSGDLTVEKKDGTKKHFVAGQVISEMVGGIHRGVTAAEPVTLIVFYSGTPGLPLSQ